MMLSQKEDDGAGFVCATPTFELVSSEKTLSAVLASHAWRVEKTEPYGTDGFLTKIVCSKCGLEVTSIISNIEDSAKWALQNRNAKDVSAT